MEARFRTPKLIRVRANATYSLSDPHALNEPSSHPNVQIIILTNNRSQESII